MFKTVSKFSAPIAAAVLLAAVGFTAPASAASRGNAPDAVSRADVVDVDHRGHRGGRGGRDWNRDRGGRHHAMNPRQIQRSLRHRGFHRIQVLDRRGPVYIVKARAWGGMPMRLVVDGRSAQILRSQPLRHGPRRHGPWH